jgi:hypothetical protein
MFNLSHSRAGDQHIQVLPSWFDAELVPIGTSRALTFAKGGTRSGIELMDGPDR